MQGRIHLAAATDIARAEKAQPAALVVFDLLRDDDRDIRGLSLAARRLRLQDALPVKTGGSAPVRLSEIVADDGREMLARAEREGWEGLIGKEGGSVYHSGRRSPSWRTLKLLKRDTFVVGGWTDPQNTRQHFGSLVLGLPETGRLRWVGNGGTRVLDVARWVKEELDRLKIPAVAKTSGSGGMHIYIKLPPKTTYQTGQLLCHIIATMV